MNDIAIPSPKHLCTHIHTTYTHVLTHTHTHKHTQTHTCKHSTCTHMQTRTHSSEHNRPWGHPETGGGGLILLKGRGVLFSHGGARDSVAHQSTLVRSRASPAVTIKSSFSCMQFQNVNRMHQVHTVTVAIMAMVAKQ